MDKSSDILCMKHFVNNTPKSEDGIIIKKMDKMAILLEPSPDHKGFSDSALCDRHKSVVLCVVGRRLYGPCLHSNYTQIRLQTGTAEEFSSGHYLRMNAPQ